MTMFVAVCEKETNDDRSNRKNKSKMRGFFAALRMTDVLVYAGAVFSSDAWRGGA
jgi:hypothetical protein